MSRGVFYEITENTGDFSMKICYDSIDHRKGVECYETYDLSDPGRESCSVRLR